MDDLLESMWREQLGEEVAPAAPASAASSSSEESESEPDEPTPPPPSAAVAGPSQPHQVWRPDVQPGKAVLRHVRRLEKARRERASSASAPLALVDIGAELARHKAMSTLTCFFLNRANRALDLELRIPPFERWAASQHPAAGSGKGADPVLPDPRVEEPQAKGGRRLLRRELLESGAGKGEAGRLLEHLDKMAVKLLGQLHRSGLGGGGGGGAAPAPVKVVFEAAKDRYVLQHKGVALACNRTHYDKLHALFDRFGGAGPAHQQPQQLGRRFHHAAFALLLRYSSLAGGTDRGGGFQGAINEEVFDVLLRRFDCRTECFASPLNCRYARFCSAFPDTDGAFGSLGSFWDFHPAEGCFEANPPFTPFVMDRMVRHMEALLDASEAAGAEAGEGEAGKKKPLAFIIIIPAWDEAHNDRAIQQACAPSWKMLRESRFCARHVLLPALGHGYIEGNQQRLPTRWKTSAFDTSVFFLQNGAARARWPVTPEAEAELRAAFASKHEEETRARRAAAQQHQPPPPPPSLQPEQAAVVGAEKGERKKMKEPKEKRPREGGEGGGGHAKKHKHKHRKPKHAEST